MTTGAKIAIGATLFALGVGGYIVYQRSRKGTSDAVSLLNNQVTELPNVTADATATVASRLEGKAISVVDEGYPVYLVQGGQKKMIVDNKRYQKGAYESKLSSELKKYFGEGNINAAIDKGLLVLVNSQQAAQFNTGPSLGFLRYY